MHGSCNYFPNCTQIDVITTQILLIYCVGSLSDILDKYILKQVSWRSISFPSQEHKALLFLQLGLAQWPNQYYLHKISASSMDVTMVHMYLTEGKSADPGQFVAMSGIKFVSGELYQTFWHLWPVVDQVAMNRVKTDKIWLLIVS